MGGRSNFQVRIPEQLRRELRYIAVRSNRSLADIATDALGQWAAAWTDPATGQGVPPFVTAGEC